jgi:hypothetical protein
MEKPREIALLAGAVVLFVKAPDLCYTVCDYLGFTRKDAPIALTGEDPPIALYGCESA